MNFSFRIYTHTAISNAAGKSIARSLILMTRYGEIYMTEKLARQIILAARPQGRPKLSDFRLEETEIPTPSAGQVLLRVEYLSLDPYMRGRMDDRKSYAKPVPLGGVMEGESVAEV